MKNRDIENLKTSFRLCQSNAARKYPYAKLVERFFIFYDIFLKNQHTSCFAVKLHNAVCRSTKKWANIQKKFSKGKRCAKV